MLCLQCRSGRVADYLHKLRCGEGGAHQRNITAGAWHHGVLRHLLDSAEHGLPEPVHPHFHDAHKEILDIAPAIIRTYALSFLLLPFNIFSTYYFQAIMKPSVASVARGLVISGLLILLLPIITGSDSLWFAMPITEAVTAIYAAMIIRKYTRALP